MESLGNEAVCSLNWGQSGMGCYPTNRYDGLMEILIGNITLMKNHSNSVILLLRKKTKANDEGIANKTETNGIIAEHRLNIKDATISWKLKPKKN